MLDRRRLIAAAAGAAALPAVAAAEAGLIAPERIVLWPRGVPGAAGVTAKQQVIERGTGGAVNRGVLHVTEPVLEVFRPAKPNGAACLVLPGGGYVGLAIDKEGAMVGRWLAGQGVTAYVLLYRLPGDHWGAGPDAPLQDVQRALRLARASAAAEGRDPKRIGVTGFSAGGHLAGSLLTRFDAAVYPAMDAADTVSARPDFAGLFYPVVTMRPPLAHAGSRTALLGPAPTPAQEAAYSLESLARPGLAPTFLLHAADDPVVPVQNSLMLHAALLAAKVPVEIHVYQEGGHGFGLTLSPDRPASLWPEAFAAWARRAGML